MRTLATFLFSVCLLACTASSATTGPVRTSRVLNRDWEFMRMDNPDRRDRVHLPHSFSMPYFMSEYFYTGEGRYGKTLDWDPAWEGKCVFLDFEGVFQLAEVMVNDAAAGKHSGGYTPFRIDMTPFLKEGKNRIEIRVDNRWNARIAPRAGEHCFSGGIYRDVRLVVVDPVHVPFQGVWIRTPLADGKPGSVSIRTEVANRGPEPVSLGIRQTICLKGGQQVTKAQSRSVNVPEGGISVVVVNAQVDNPSLWSPATPALYEVKTELVADDGRVLDSAVHEFGFRTTEWTAERGFFLNGRHVEILGANVHQDHAGWGDAVTNGGHRRDVALMKEAGFNFIRGSHYPRDPAFVEACDRMGMLMMSEGVFWGMGGAKENDRYWNCDAYPTDPADRKEFEESCEQQLREMIRTFRNNPSVVVWSVGNEAFFSKDQKEAKAFAARLIEIAKQEDPDRPACIGGGQRGGFDELGDIACYNGDGAKVRDPGRPNLVSEYGSVSCKRPGNYDPGWGDTKDGTYPWRAGRAIWCGFDHGSIWPSGGRMGIVDYFRIPKRSWYWYRNALRGVPPPEWPVAGKPAALVLSADRTVIDSCDGQDDVHLTVRLVDRQGRQVDAVAEVTLEIISGPGEFPTGKRITFKPGSDIDLAEGCAAIEMRSYYAGKTVVRALSEGLADGELFIVTKGDVRYDKATAVETIDQPYKRFTKEDHEAGAARHNAGTANLALHRPCQVSSNAADAPKAADGDKSTFWAPDPADPAPSWTVDLEFEMEISKIKYSMATSCNRTVRLATSLDGKKWAEEGLHTGSPRGVQSSYAKPLKARFVRISFDKAEGVKLAEVSLTSR